MRTSPALALLLGSLLCVSTAAAATPLLTDAAGDVACIAAVVDTPLPGAPCSNVEPFKGNDLVSLAIGETDDTLDLTLGVATMQGDLQSTSANVLLDWNGKSYQVWMSYFSGVNGGEGSTFAYLMVEEGGEWDWVAQLTDPIAVREAATLAVSVPKVYLLDAQKRIPGLGDTINVTQVVTDRNFISFGVADVQVNDAMPDEAAATPYVLTKGDTSAGDIILIAPERVRVSNGGATTFVFQVEAKNPSDADQEYAFAAADLPQGWNATVQTPVRVAAKESKTVSILLSVPFAHEHGGYSAFNLTAQSTLDGATHARIRMGVLHTPIPQPAGHHSELYLHASADGGELDAVFGTLFPFAWGWMNTVSDHTDDAEFATPSNGGGIFFSGSDETAWYVGLDPGLLVGLDFDTDGLATLDGAITGGLPGESEIRADLYYWSDTGSGGESILLAEGEAVPITLTGQDPAPFKMTLTPTEESDYVAYAPESYIWLEITMPRSPLEGLTPSQSPRLMIEPFKLFLPLNEYHDRLTGATEAANAIELVAKGLVEKVGQPGTVLTYAFDVKNPGAAGAFVFDLAGNDVDQARLVPRGEFELASGESREVTLAVEIPFNANPGEEFEVLLFVHSRDDPSKMAVARTKTRVTSDANEAMPDESATLLAAQARENDTPGAGIVLVAGVSATVALMSRRRR